MAPQGDEPRASSEDSAWEKAARAIFGEPATRSGKRQLVIGCAVLVLQFLLLVWFWRLDLGSYLNLALGLMFVLSGGGHLLYASRRTPANVLRLAAILAFAAVLFLIVAMVVDWIA
jgi:drug/metabolite transporter (DMT)-like permease